MNTTTELGFMEDWDLQAVVNGYNNLTQQEQFLMIDEDSLWGNYYSEEISSDPTTTTTTTVFDELGVFYEPFYPLSTQTVLTTSTPVPSTAQMKEVQMGKKLECFSKASKSTGHEAKPKRSKKNQQKRVVQEVTAEGLSSDMWAWRKYGQKPIKGSPYPRSYYRCSSLKGCLARKQVERSPSDPGKFIVTYTAEHSHGQPTRRNSLSGSTRNNNNNNKSVVIQKKTDRNIDNNQQTIDHLETTTTTTTTTKVLASPTTPSTTNYSTETDSIQTETSGVTKQDEPKGETVGGDDEMVRTDISDMMSSYDLFPSLDDHMLCNGLITDFGFDGWFFD